MKKIAIIGTVIFVGLVSVFYSYVFRDNQELHETVKTDFVDKYPDYQFIDCSVGEGDLVVAYVHVKFKKPEDDKIQQEVWQYWDTDGGWLHRDKYLDVTKDKKEECENLSAVTSGPLSGKRQA